MKISKKGEYALRALIDFALADAADRPLLQVSELASKEDFPVKFLEQILMQLKAAGYLKSRRGKHGGYLLARSSGDLIVLFRRADHCKPLRRLLTPVSPPPQMSHC